MKDKLLEKKGDTLIFKLCLCTKHVFKEKRVLVTHEHSARAIQGPIFFVRANQRFFMNERRTSIGIQSALMFTSIQTSQEYARYITTIYESPLLASLYVCLQYIYILSLS